MQKEKTNVKLIISGMTCVNCQNRIEKKLKEADGIISVSVSYKNGTAQIGYDDGKISLNKIIADIENLGYKVLKEKQKSNIVNLICMLVIIISLYVMLQSMGILNFLVPSQLADARMGYGMLFVIGLLTSVHCIAMCGGINLSQCIPGSGYDIKGKSRSAVFLPAVAYNFGRVFSYTMIGFVLGLVGFLIGGSMELVLSVLLQGILKVAAGLLMVIMGINMLGLFPWLRRFTFSTPEFIAQKIGRERAKSSRTFWVGVLNGFMPCGPLQSMWIVALASGNPFTGALSMFLFSLGTVPLMLGLGSIVIVLGKKFKDAVMAVGAVLVIVLGLAMFSQGGSLCGWNMLDQSNMENNEEAAIIDDVQVVNSTLSPGRYPNITVQAGIPVRWIIDAPKGSINGCNYKILVRDYDIEYVFQTGENVIEFTPEKTGTIRYSCWMGMIHGNIFVIDGDGSDAAISETEIRVPVPAGYVIPAEKIAVASCDSDENGNEMQKVSIQLTDEGFMPAVVVLQSNTTAIWNINNQINSGGTELLAPYYSARLSLPEGSNSLSLYPLESFDVSTGDNRYYCYVKVVDDLDRIDENAIREEAASYETMIYPSEVFESSAGSCCSY